MARAPHPTLLLLSVVALCSPAAAQGPLRAEQPRSGLVARGPGLRTGVTPVAWTAPLPAELAGAEAYAFNRRRILGFVGGDVPRVLALETISSGTSGTVTATPLAGLPGGGFRFIDVSLDARQGACFVLAELGDTKRPAFFWSRLGANGLPSGFTEARLPSPLGEPRFVRASELAVFVGGQLDTETGPALKFWGASMGPGGPTPWREGDPLKADLAAPGIVARDERLILVGGARSLAGRAAPAEDRTGRTLTLGVDNLTPWTPLLHPLPGMGGRTQVLDAGSVLLGYSEPIEVSRRDRLTSLTIVTAGFEEIGVPRLWRAVTYNHPWVVGPRLLLNPTDSQLLVLGGTYLDGSSSAEIVAINVPSGMMARPPRQEEARVERIDRMRELLRGGTMQEAVARARQRETYIVTLLSDTSSETENVFQSIIMGGAYRDHLSSVVLCMPVGDEAAELKKRFGISQLPAMVLHTTGGNVLSRHEGSKPTPKELFDFMKPARQPAPIRIPPVDDAPVPAR